MWFAGVAALPCAASPAAEPPAVEIRFEGRRGLGEAALRKAAEEELAAFGQKGFRRADVDDAAHRMELAYRQAGFAFAMVEYRIEEEPQRIHVTFAITEGPRVVLERVEPAGNSAFDDQELRRFFEPERKPLLDTAPPVFIRNEVLAAVAAITERYRDKGYLDIAIDAPEIRFSVDRSRATVHLSIREGPRYFIREIIWEGESPEETRKPLASLREELTGQPMIARRRGLLQNRIEEIFAEQGFPDASAAVRQVSAGEDGAVVLAVEITSGEAVAIREVTVSGNERTRESFIRNRVRMQPGERYSRTAERETFRELYRTGLFSNVLVALAEEKGPQRALSVVVVEAPAREVFVEPGWGSYELLRLRVGFRENNLLGYGVHLGTDAKVSVKDQGLNANLTDPFFLDTQTNASLAGFFTHREEPSFTQQELGGSLFFSRKLAEHLTATVGYRLKTVSLSQVDAEEIAEAADRDYDLGSVKALATYDDRDNIFFPTRGGRGTFSVEFADPALGGDVGFTRLAAGVRAFFQLAPSTVLGLRYDTGLILPAAGEVAVPVSERFFNGGENTVRSFRQSELGPVDETGKPTGGLAYNVLGVELRQRIIGNFIGTVFLDLGNVAPNRAPSESGRSAYDSRSQIISDTFSDYFKELRPGVGFGLQYMLPVGPARLDLAFNPDRDAQRDEDRFAVHFSVGMAF
ncbi:MAG: outer membrane protein assembly factor BamA [Desulfobacterales bacterium]|jgi:outer membrane protein assembly complex protein YaeT|nr:outer membrane protein assembly factor BamA [Desulfobacterales bacterium]MCU0561728.1 outer membrane protein assembly factor BamA [Desulfobacterales bacterium]